MATLYGAIRMLFTNQGHYCRAYINGVVKVIDCPRSQLPYIDNPMVDFNIRTLENGITLVYFKQVNAYVVLMGTTYTDTLTALDVAMNVIKEYTNNPQSRKTLLL